MNTPKTLFSLIIMLTTAAPVHAQDDHQEEPVDETFLEQYAATYGFSLGRPTQLTVTPDGEEVLFLRSGPRSFVRDLFSFDTETGEERVLLTAEQVLEGAAEEMSDAERARRERLRLAARGIASYELSKDGQRILVPLSGRLFVIERETGTVVELHSELGYADAPHFSPDGNHVACVRDGDLYVFDVETGAERRLTETSSEHVTNGLAEFIAQEEMGRYRGYWWTPASDGFLFQETDLTDVEILHIVDPMHPEQEPHSAAFPRAGTENARVRLGLISLEGEQLAWVEWDNDIYPYLATVRWSADSPLTLVVQNRRQNEEQILVVDIATGQTSPIHTETDDAWLNLDQDMPRWLDSGEAFLWTTERNGAWQLELRANDGNLLEELTPIDFGYRNLVHVDEENRVVWVRGGEEPTETHVFRVPLDPSTGPPELITDQTGLHSATFGEDHNVWVHTYNLSSGARGMAVRVGEEIRGELQSHAEEPPFMPQPELVTVGSRDYRAVIIRPRTFDESQTYPVLVYVYGGPMAQMVRAIPRYYLIEQWLADQGYVVVSVDGRGTPNRGREWERAILDNFIDIPLADQVEALQALGEQYSELDLSRVGITGWSFGGYFSAMAVMQRPDVFHAAVAGAPVADWRDYDTHYTERYIGLPEENPEAYEQSSVLTFAEQLTRPLLIIHGTADDNVYFTHAIRMSDALLRAGRPHQFLPLSGFTHMVAEPSVTEALQTIIIGFFQERL